MWDTEVTLLIGDISLDIQAGLVVDQFGHVSVDLCK